MNINEIYKNIINNGYFKTNDPEVFRFFEEIDGWSWKNLKDQGLQMIEHSEEVDTAINNTQLLIAEKYVKHLDNNYKLGDECDIVNGMDDATLSWHNDSQEGYNLSVLLYFDTMDSDIGGELSFRGIDSKEVTGSFYPKKHDIVFMNHGTQFEHIVGSLKMPLHRRVATFNYHLSAALID
jgi:hypothetical protein